MIIILCVNILVYMTKTQWDFILVSHLLLLSFYVIAMMILMNHMKFAICNMSEWGSVYICSMICFFFRTLNSSILNLRFIHALIFEVTPIVLYQGAYTGVCSAQHVPSYKNNIEKFKAKGVDSVICVAVNDPYVLNGWAEKLQAKEAVRSYSFSF